jgi:hypothetical protein
MRKRFISMAVCAFVAGLAFAQPTYRIFTKPGETPVAPAQKTAVTSETELKFRITGMHQGRAIGTLLAKVDGKWVEVQLAPQDMLLRAK